MFYPSTVPFGGRLLGDRWGNLIITKSISKHSKPLLFTCGKPV